VKESYQPPNRDNYRFSTSLQVEAIGNAHFLELMEHEDIENVTIKPAYQLKGIDFIVKLFFGDVTIDTKNDTHLTSNVFLETMSVVEHQKRGCFLTSEADLWFYYLMNRAEMFVIPVQEAREFILPRLPQFPTVRVPNRSGAGKTIAYHSEGLLVPWSVLLEGVPNTFHIDLTKQLTGLPVYAPSVLPPGYKFRSLDLELLWEIVHAERHAPSPVAGHSGSTGVRGFS